MVPSGSYTATEEFPFFVAVQEGFCWNTFQLVGYALLDIIQSTKMAPFQVVLSRGWGTTGMLFSATNSLMESAVQRGRFLMPKSRVNI
jgi:hypothetical protein